MRKRIKSRTIENIIDRATRRQLIKILKLIAKKLNVKLLEE